MSVARADAYALPVDARNYTGPELGIRLQQPRTFFRPRVPLAKANKIPGPDDQETAAGTEKTQQHRQCHFQQTGKQ